MGIRNKNNKVIIQQNLDSPWKGYVIDFEHENIIMRCSALTGREEVFVNEESVSKCFSWRFKNRHCFAASGVSYEIEVNTLDPLLGKISFALIKEGVHVKTIVVSITPQQFAKITAKGFLFGFVFGAIGMFVGFYLTDPEVIVRILERLMG